MKEPTGPKPLRDFFAVYKKRLQAPETAVKDEFIAVVKDLLTISISSQMISYKTTTQTVVIKNGMLRSEILPHKAQVLAHLRDRLGKRSAPIDIR